MKIYLAGAESASHKKVMTSIGAQDVALSFIGLSRRVKHLNNWTLETKFPDGMNIFLDSGAHSINSAEDKYTQAQLMDLAESYYEYVKANIERIEVFSEFDAAPLGREWIESQRDRFIALDPQKFMPIWHADQGEQTLREMGDDYYHVGITATSLAGRNLVPALNSLSNSGALLHGVGITSLDDLYSIRWNSVSSTSWLAPQQWGETHIWTGKTLKRYPKKMKDQARKRYRTYLDNVGFDSELIETDDSTELLRLSAWSWQQLMDDIDKKHGSGEYKAPDPVTNVDFATGEVISQTTPEVVDTPASEDLKSPATIQARETTVLPILGQKTVQTTAYADDGTELLTENTTLNIRGDSTRRCQTCFLASKCPAFEQNSTCAYSIPITITTQDELKALHTSMVEMQAQRVLFMRFAEEQEGGYADPNLSGEIDRLNKLIKTKVEIEQEGFSVKFEAKGTSSAEAGMISRLFGQSASEKARALPQPLDADQVIIDAEIVQEWTES